MNANEVIANLANQQLGFGVGAKGKEGAVHPNDHVNMGQSSNDTFPAAMHVAAALAVSKRADPRARAAARGARRPRPSEWDNDRQDRPHASDGRHADPRGPGVRRLRGPGRVRGDSRRAGRSSGLQENMPIGGTAVGTGINTHPKFADKVCAALSNEAGRRRSPKPTNHPEAQAAKDSFVEAHGELKTIAVSLTKIANDIRWLGTGPRCGIFELSLPATQPGSSIMPGKVNPVICESVMQVACRVIGNDAVVTTAALGGIGSLFELNVAMPVMIDAFLESVKLLANVAERVRRQAARRPGSERRALPRS